MSRRQERLYGIWKGIKVRTHNTHHKDYKYCGAKGITICDEWDKSYEAFKEWALNNGYRDDLTIDRIDNSGNYCPENCRWADLYTQANNKSNNHLITYNGKTQNMTQWAREIGVRRELIKDRLKSGWSVKDALTKEKREPGESILNRFLTYNGKTMTASRWADELGINKGTLSYRLNQLGWSTEKALSTPVRKRG